jgi:hypothetical protein
MSTTTHFAFPNRGGPVNERRETKRREEEKMRKEKEGLVSLFWSGLVCSVLLFFSTRKRETVLVIDGVCWS